MRRPWWALVIALAVVPSACGDDGGEGSPTAVGSALVEPGGRTVHLRLESCNTTQQQAEVVESADEIRVTVRVQGGDPEEACQDSMIVQLTDRRGNRPLIDETTGDEIPLDDG